MKVVNWDNACGHRFVAFLSEGMDWKEEGFYC